MIELPEAITIARQMNGHVKARRVASAERENSPHKWVKSDQAREA